MPMRRPSTRLAFLLFAVLILTGVLLWLFVEKPSAPRCARLLPESDAILYFNLRPLRAATHFERHSVTHDPTYQQFIDASGIDVERDLDEAAFALHRSANAFGPNGPVAYSEVFRGRFDSVRLSAYLGHTAQSQQSYAGRTIYSIASQGRTVRIALLSSSLVAVSNTPTPEQIHSMIDQADSWLLGPAGPTLLRAHYRDVPLLSLAWGLGQLGLPFAEHGAMQVLGLALPFRLETVFIASVRWTGSLRLRLEQIAPTEDAATAAAASLRSLVSIGRLAENNLPGGFANPDARALLNSATVTQAGDRATLNATLPDHLVEKLMAPVTPIAPPQR